MLVCRTAFRLAKSRRGGAWTAWPHLFGGEPVIAGALIWRQGVIYFDQSTLAKLQSTQVSKY